MVELVVEFEVGEGRREVIYRAVEAEAKYHRGDCLWEVIDMVVKRISKSNLCKVRR